MATFSLLPNFLTILEILPKFWHTKIGIKVNRPLAGRISYIVIKIWQQNKCSYFFLATLSKFGKVEACIIRIHLLRSFVTCSCKGEKGLYYYYEASELSLLVCFAQKKHWCYFCWVNQYIYTSTVVKYCWVRTNIVDPIQKHDWHVKCNEKMEWRCLVVKSLVGRVWFGKRLRLRMIVSVPHGPDGARWSKGREEYSYSYWDANIWEYYLKCTWQGIR